MNSRLESRTIVLSGGENNWTDICLTCSDRSGCSSNPHNGNILLTIAHPPIEVNEVLYGDFITAAV